MLWADNTESGRRMARIETLRSLIVSDSDSKGRAFPLPAFAGTSFAGMTVRDADPMAFRRTWYKIVEVIGDFIANYALYQQTRPATAHRMAAAGAGLFAHSRACALSASRWAPLSWRPIVSGAGPRLALWWYGFAFECLFWGVDGQLANLF